MMNMGAERQDIRLAIIVTVFVYGWGLFYFATLWTLAPDGLSATTGSTPYWDFSNLWSAGRLILDGHVDWLFEPDHYRAWLRLTFSEALPNQEWSYPPNLFFLAVPLGALPIMPAYLLWTFGTILCLHFAIRPLALPPLAHWLAITGPAVWMNAAFWPEWRTDGSVAARWIAQSGAPPYSCRRPHRFYGHQAASCAVGALLRACEP